MSFAFYKKLEQCSLEVKSLNEEKLINALVTTGHVIDNSIQSFSTESFSVQFNRSPTMVIYTIAFTNSPVLWAAATMGILVRSSAATCWYYGRSGLCKLVLWAYWQSWCCWYVYPPPPPPPPPGKK